MRKTVLTILILLTISSLTYAQKVNLNRDVEIRHTLFWESRLVMVQAERSPDGSNSQYRENFKRETQYFLCSAIEITNKTNKEIKDLEVTCNFINKWDKKRAWNKLTFNLKPSEKTRAIFKSRLFQPQGLAPIKGPILTEMEQKDFLHNRKNLEMKMDPDTSLGIETIKCRFHLKHGKQELDYKY